jgi:hypothetical protein
MAIASGVRRSGEPRACGIARRLGYTVRCPDGGCALLDSLGKELPADRRAVCPVEDLAGDNVVVLWTMDELRREMQRDAEAVPADRARADIARR